MKKIILCLLLVFLVGCSSGSKETKKTVKKEEKKETIVEDVNETITLSFAGDCTLGNYAGQAYDGSFNQEYVNQGKDSSYFLRNVKDVFASDDLTIVNLEGPLTTATSHVEKTFPFSGLPEYTNILTDGSVEAVTVANNHSEDYYEVGMSDTKTNLDNAGIDHFGYDEYLVKEVKGVKIGFLGYRSMSISMNNDAGKAKISSAINTLKTQEQCNLVFVYYHWGIEREYSANDDQRSLAHFSIDSGADGVIGSHPHVIQGTEEYNGKPIVYSLGNFCFGGNRNPSDQDSMIYQLTYSFTNNQETGHNVNIIPCKLSSSSSRNNYQPMILAGDNGQRVLDKIKKYSY